MRNVLNQIQGIAVACTIAAMISVLIVCTGILFIFGKGIKID